MNNNEELLEKLSKDIGELLEEVELFPLAHGKERKGLNSYRDISVNLISGARYQCEFYKIKGDAQYLQNAGKVIEVVRLYFALLSRNEEFFDKEYEEPPEGELDITRAFPDLYQNEAKYPKIYYILESAKRLGESVDESLGDVL